MKRIGKHGKKLKSGKSEKNGGPILIGEKKYHEFLRPFLS